MKSWRSAVGLVLVAVALGWFVLLIPEWWAFLVRRDFSRAGDYPFGTEQGWSYSNPLVYGWSTLAAAVLALAMAVLARTALVRRSWWYAGALLFLLVGWRVADKICSTVDWPVFERFAHEGRITG